MTNLLFSHPHFFDILHIILVEKIVFVLNNIYICTTVCVAVIG